MIHNGTQQQTLADLMNMPDAAPQTWTLSRGCRILAYGEPSVGKTDTGLSIPGYKFVFDFERNVEEVATNMVREGRLNPAEVIIRRYAVPILQDKAQARKIADQFLDDYHSKCIGKMVAMKNQGVLDMTNPPVFIVDSSTKLWDLIRYAYVPLDDKGHTRNQMDYGGVNELYQAVLEGPKNHGFIFYGTARTEDNFVNYADEEGKRKWYVAGKKPDWQKHTHFMTDVVLELTKVFTPDPLDATKQKAVRMARIAKCTANPSIEEDTYPTSWSVIRNALES